jgi:Uma2 family endonuclease
MLHRRPAVRIDPETVYEPDCLVQCGHSLSDDAIETATPLVVVEILSPATRRHDVATKLVGYFRLSSLRHYLIVDADSRMIIHHARDEAGIITTRIIHDGAVTLDPPGIVIADLFA